MNERWIEFYESAGFGHLVRDHLVPSMLDAGSLGEDALLVVAGPGPEAEALRASVPRLTVAQVDPSSADTIDRRFAADPDVTEVAVDPTELPFGDDRFTGAVIMLSLHHLASETEQDVLLAEVLRVLRPGALLVGTNALDGPLMRRLAEGDEVTPVDPWTMVRRLEAAGFDDLGYDLWQFPRFSARKPA